MNSDRQRQNDLEEHITKDLQLQKQLEDRLRFESEPMQKNKLKEDINEIKNRINDYRNELSSYVGEKNNPDLALAMTKITFKELEIVTKGILCMPLPTETDFTLIPPTEKSFKNKLSSAIQSRLLIGLIKAQDVKKFVEHMATLIPEFPEKLRSGFVVEYNRLRQQGIEGDDLFNYLHNFACSHSQDYDLQTAGLAVLSYFFERCDLFER